MHYLFLNGEVVKCECVNCGLPIPILEMRSHMAECGGGPSNVRYDLSPKG